MNRTIDIAHVIFRLDVGGLENGLTNLINRLDENTYRHSIISLEEPTSFSDRITSKNVKVYTINKKPGKDPHAYLRLYRLLRQIRPDVVHTRNIGTVDVSLAAALARVPHRIHGEHGWELTDLQGTRARYRTLRRVCQPFIERFVCVSRHLEHWLEHSIGIPPKKIVHIANGVDTLRFAPRSGNQRPVGRESMPADAIVIGTVGRLIRLKNHRLLIEAFSSLLDKASPYTDLLRLTIVGDGPEHASLVAQARELGLADRIWFAGRRDDVDELMRSFDVFVLPSLQEGMSNTLLEAMSSGVAVIAADVGGNSELVEDAVSGSLVPSQDKSALVERLEKYVADPLLRKSHGAAARARVEKQFSLTSMADAYSHLYRRIAGAANATRS